MATRNTAIPGVRYLSAAIILLAGSTLSSAFAAPLASQHAAHRAYYTITLGAAHGDSQVLDVQGRMVAEWSENCEGWTANQRLAVSIVRQEGAPLASEVLATSFESTDGTRYRFATKTTIDGKVVEELRGEAKRAGRAAAGEAVYSMPGDVRIALPAGTLFPYEHTLALIAAAEKGDNVAYSFYFDGSQPDISPLGASAVIVGKKRAPGEGTGTGLGPLTQRGWWSVRLAMFPRANDAGQPEFEMTQDLQDNGVVRRFVFDYGDFTMEASLVRVEALPHPACDG